MLNKYKRFLLIFSIIVLIFSTPIYAFVRVMLPDILLERIRNELAIADTARIAYSAALKAELGKEKSDKAKSK